MEHPPTVDNLGSCQSRLPLAIRQVSRGPITWSLFHGFLAGLGLFHRADAGPAGGTRTPVRDKARSEQLVLLPGLTTSGCCEAYQTSGLQLKQIEAAKRQSDLAVSGRHAGIWKTSLPASEQVREVRGKRLTSSSSQPFFT
ncbi:unnamed protein product [Symbiodinium natans]|uniref:Uncharacterized protein n=1 Tax=Symbiodinium natans TaxID=878477 RepID=A0A812M1Z3_9DINO|nr:unnamed protein product [Symbiodinium natans]